MAYTLPPKGMRLPAFPTETRPETDKVPWGQIQLGDYVVYQACRRTSTDIASAGAVSIAGSELNLITRGSPHVLESRCAHELKGAKDGRANGKEAGSKAGRRFERLLPPRLHRHGGGRRCCGCDRLRIGSHARHGSRREHKNSRWYM